MSDVLISIRPQWVELIASGRKTREIRKSCPKIPTPFKAYMYMTRHPWLFDLLRGLGMHELAAVLSHGSGKVVGEFVCDDIKKIFYDADILYGIDHPNEYGNKIAAESCLDLKEILEYFKGKDGYSWHISELKIYQDPKPLKAFKRWEDYGMWSHLINVTRAPQSWFYVEEQSE